LRELVRQAIGERAACSPVHAFQASMRTLLQAGHPVFRITERPVQFWRTVTESPALTTRARELQVTLADDLAAMLSVSVDRLPSDPDARLAAAMLVSTLVVAYGDALRALREGEDPVDAFVRVMERGFTGVNATLAGTPYV
jgi:hypothetical protein